MDFEESLGAEKIEGIDARDIGQAGGDVLHRVVLAEDFDGGYFDVAIGYHETPLVIRADYNSDRGENIYR